MVVLIILSFLIFPMNSFTQTTMGAQSLGAEMWSTSAANAGRGQAGMARIREGASVHNPAANAFDDQTLFSAKLGFGWFRNTGNSCEGCVQEGENWSNDGFTSSVDAVQMSIPMGGFGSLGFVWWQRFRKDLEVQTTDPDSNSAKLNHRGGVFELVPTYSWRLPREMRFLALGAAWHIPLGRENKSFELRQPGESGSFLPQEVVHYEMNRTKWSLDETHSPYSAQGGYPSLSLHWRARRWDYVLGFSFPHRLQSDATYFLGTSQLDTLVASSITNYIHVPGMWRVGISIRPNVKHTISMDFHGRAPMNNGQTLLSEEKAGQSTYMAALGYQREGSGQFFDSWQRKMVFRAGTWFQTWYEEEIYEFGGSFGAGMPLGRRGARLDFTLRAGHRAMLVDGSGGWDEAFVGIDLGLTGIGAWGKPSRRYR